MRCRCGDVRVLLLVYGRCVIYAEVVLYALEMLEGMRRVLHCTQEDLEGEVCLLEVSEVLEMLEVMRRVMLCMLEAVEGEVCLLVVLEVV